MILNIFRHYCCKAVNHNENCKTCSYFFGDEEENAYKIIAYYEWSVKVEKIDLTEKERRIAQLLVKYMLKNPEAKHTTEGIARWWVMQQKFEEEIKVVEKVIEYLTNIGVLEKVLLPGDNTYCKFNPEKVVNNSRIWNDNLNFKQ